MSNDGPTPMGGGDDCDAEFSEPPPTAGAAEPASELTKEAPQDGGRTARWWRQLGLPTDPAAAASLREAYSAKLAAHSAGKAEDPLAESLLEAACGPAHADLARGCGFPDEHPLSVAARAGDLDQAEIVSILFGGGLRGCETKFLSRSI